MSQCVFECGRGLLALPSHDTAICALSVTPLPGHTASPFAQTTPKMHALRQLTDWQNRGISVSPGRGQEPQTHCDVNTDCEVRHTDMPAGCLCGSVGVDYVGGVEEEVEWARVWVWARPW